jgi:protein-disulfide isomerase
MNRLNLRTFITAGLAVAIGVLVSTACVAPPNAGDKAAAQQGGGAFVRMDDVDTSFNDKITGERYQITYEEGDLWKGAPTGALVTIVEYSDFQCPYCKRLNDTLVQVAEAYPDDVRIVFKHFPLPMHKQAQPASEAVLAAQAQGKGWEMHDKIWENNRALSNENLVDYATQIGVPDVAKFKADLEGHTYAAKVKSDMDQGKKFAVRSTPSFFINGKPQRGAMNFDRLKALIEEEKAFAQGLVDAGSKREEVYARIMKASKTERAAPPPDPKQQQKQRPGEPDPAVNYAIPVGEGRPIKGNVEALVTIVEWSDFECPYCSKVLPTLTQIEKDYGDKVRVVFRQQPLPMHKNAPAAAKAALAAHRQGKFWEMHDKLFAAAPQKQLGPTVDSYTAFATELGLDVEKFKTDFADPVFDTMIKEDQEVAAKFGGGGTPSFFINGRPLSGARPYEQFKAVIDEELVKAEKWAKEHKDVTPDKLYDEMIKGFETEVKAPPIADHQRRDISLAGMYGKGNLKDPKLTIVECSDFDCPYCKKGADLVAQIMAAPEYAGKVAFYFANLPLKMHPKAEPAHRAAIAAGKQGKFFEMHDLLFADKAKREEQDFRDMAAQLGLDVEKFITDWNAEATKQQVLDETALCNKFGVTGTPAFFINGRLMRGAVPFEMAKAVLDEELAGGFEAKAKAAADAKPADGKDAAAPAKGDAKDEGKKDKAKNEGKALGKDEGKDKDKKDG